VYRIDRIQLLTQVSLHRRSRDIRTQSPTERGARGLEGREEGDRNLIPASPSPRDTDDGAVLALGHQRQMTLHPSTSKNW